MQDFGTPRQMPLRLVDEGALRQLLDSGAFPAGSMQPKIAAALDFLASGGRQVIITDPAHLTAGLQGNTGTCIQAV
jgi:carbamate kinase